MSHMRPDDIAEARRRNRDQGEYLSVRQASVPAAGLSASAYQEFSDQADRYHADQQRAGLAALISIGRQIDQDSDGHAANRQNLTGQYGGAVSQRADSPPRVLGSAWLTAAAP